MSGLISASEVAFFSLKGDDLDRCRESDDPKSRNIVALLKNPRLLLASILVMNNFVNVAIVTLATFIMWEMVGSREPAEMVVGIVTFIVTFAITFFGEIVPKVYATQRNLFMARRLSGGWKVLEKVCWPITWPLIKFSKIIERRFEKKGYTTTVEELNQALELTTRNNDTTEEEKDILKGIVNFGTLSAKQIMKSRVDINAVDLEMNFIQLLEFVKKSGYSRIPVYRDSIDKIEGILYIKDLLPYLKESESFKWQNLLRPGFFVPETKRLDSLLKDFQSKRVHVAVVVDEYGGTSGLVTLEDLIEEIIGEINDEFDEIHVPYQKIDDKNYMFEGKTSLNDFCKVLNADAEIFNEVKGESESLGGLLLELNAVLPEVGEKIKFDHFSFVVVAVDAKRIKRIQVTIDRPEPSEAL